MPKAPRTLSNVPTITLEHDTDLNYVAAANSRVLPDWAQEVLDAAENGQEVNAWTLHAALDQALSACAHRDGQSPIRRRRAAQVRHLIYKVDAVLENFIEGLPPVEPGARSPKIARLEEELSTERERTTALIREKTDLEIALDSLTTASLQTTSRLGEAESANANLAEEVDRLTMLLRQADESWSRLHAVWFEQVRVTDYARSHLDEVGRAKVEGYIEGLRDAR